tara:strand:- start:1481 stop:1687 length:207 start_codon:yes stop_codon:yes gene_type:complete
MRTEITTTSTQNSKKAGIYNIPGSCEARGFTKTFGHIKMSFTVITVIKNIEQWHERITSDEYDIIPKN